MISEKDLSINDEDDEKKNPISRDKSYWTINIIIRQLMTRGDEENILNRSYWAKNTSLM